MVWFASYLVFLGTSYGTKDTYRFSLKLFNTIFALLNIPSPFRRRAYYPPGQVDILMALATMASYKAASTCRVAKCAAEDAWLLSGNTGPVVDATLWKRIFKGIRVYKGKTFSEKTAVLPAQVRRKIQRMVQSQEHLTVNGAKIILAELCGVLLGLRRSEHFASAERNPNLTTLLCFKNLAGTT